MISSNNLIDNNGKRFRSLAFLTVLIIYLLVLAGGIVRGTGSGMGCPDWPKCFGQWIPPTDISQLPPNYQEIYGARLKGEVEFNPVKTWIEYANRLLGVLSGFFVFATLVASFSYWRRDRVVVLGSVISFLFIGLNGWLGSRVVATELAHYAITLHLLLAILVVFSLLFVYVRASTTEWRTNNINPKRRAVNTLLLVTAILSLGQVLLGTQVRDSLNEVIAQLGYDHRDSWIEGLNWRFYVHRSFSLVVLLFHLVVIYRLRQVQKGGLLNQIALWIAGLVVVEIVTGVVMAYWAVPAAAQPIHLFLAVIIVGLQFVAWLVLNPALSLPRELVKRVSLSESV
ncbi:MAG: COX15/CtaA family protein [Spirosoma sp.]|nr:COX15/CtaA family protein [Spirosoma sp.]